MVPRRAIVKWTFLVCCFVSGLYYLTHLLSTGGEGHERKVVHLHVSRTNKSTLESLGRTTAETSAWPRPPLPVTPTHILQPTQKMGSNTAAKFNHKTSCNRVIDQFNISSSSYVMALSYWEQLTMATNSLCGLTNFARSWHSKAVIPFTINAEFYGLPSTVNFPTVTGTPPIYYKGPTKSISMLYDIGKFSSDLLCKNYNLPPLASFKEFILKANRQIILMHINFHDVPPKSLFKGKNYADCMEFKQIKSAGSKLIKALNKESDKHGLAPFELHSACCLNHMHIIKTPQEIADACGFANNDHLTIVFTVWRGYSNIPTKKFRLITEVSSLFDKPSPGKDSYPLSTGVISNSSAFVKSLSCKSDSKLIVIHLRTAKLAMMGGGMATFRTCFKKTENVLKELTSNCSQIGTCGNRACYRYFVDYGEFGSHSYEVKLGQKASTGLLQEKHITPVSYDPRKFGGMKDQGFVALVEQLSMAQSDILILVGGGSFQEQIRKRFIQDGRGSRVYEVCHTKVKLTQMIYERHHLTR